MTLTHPILSIACLMPLVYAWLVSRYAAPERARSIAWFGAISTLATIVGVITMFYAAPDASTLVEPALSLEGARIHYQLGVDALSAPMLVLVSAVVLLIVWIGPQHELTPQTLAAMLATEGFTLAMFAARDLLLFALCWIAALIPMNLWTRGRLPARSRARRMLLLMSVGSSVPLVSAVLWLAASGRTHHIDTFDLLQLHAHGVPADVQAPIFILVTLAALIRMGVFPFHAWLPAIWRGAPLPISALTVTAPAGVLLLARFGLPLLPQPAAGRVPLIADLALMSALYGALLALGQKDLKRMLGALAVSQSGMMLIGLASANAQGETGALLLCIGDRVALCGLFITVWLLRVRTGTTDMTRLGGMMHSTPRMAAAFALFGIASMGVPGTLGFVAEDLVVSGIIESYPWIVLVVLATTMLNGITLARAFSRTFMGPARDAQVERGVIADLAPTERWALAALIAFLISAGVAPQTLTRAVHRATHEMEANTVSLTLHHDQ